ncbi:hypothetical protein Q6244_27855 [Klebsiella pneumoniae]|nr:hypothetical protein [Klebsiella pneumoniae]MDP1177579.1 hypothetical protein [Klebsiella pneumoniae]
MPAGPDAPCAPLCWHWWGGLFCAARQTGARRLSVWGRDGGGSSA